MHLRVVRILSVGLLLLPLSACGSSNVESTPNQESSGVWGFTLQKVSNDYANATPVCDEPRDTEVLCKFSFNITNISKLPQRVEGTYFLETSDGRIFQEIDGDPGGVTGVVNPGEEVYQRAEFFVPIRGVTAKKIYRAFEATDTPIYVYEFENMWILSE